MENIEKLMGETFSFGPIEMANEMKSQPAAAAPAAENKTDNSIGWYIVIGLMVVGGLAFLIHKEEQKKRTTTIPTNSKPVTS